MLSEEGSIMAEFRIMTWWDPACRDAIRVVEKAGKGSIDIIMKGLKVGYCRAEFLLEILQRMGVLRESKKQHGTYKLVRNNIK
jgi:DNA segregation ATPase FtsK/SpoIIIE-like protein